jgi:5'-3' exonuclease
MLMTKVNRASFIDAYNVRSFYEKARFKRVKGNKAYDVYVIFDHNLGIRTQQESALVKKNAKGIGKKTLIVIVFKKEEDVDFIINNVNELEPNLNDDTDNTFIKYKRAALNSHRKKEHFCRELRDIPIIIVFLEKDVIVISNKMIKEEEEAQGKALKAVKAMEENNLFVLSDDIDVDNENRVPLNT